MSTISLKLENIYRETIYKVFFQKKEIHLQVGKTSEEMDTLLDYFNSNCFVFITAANPNSLRKSEKVNKINNLKLKRKLYLKKIDFLNGVGISADGKWKEKSFCVFGISKSDANEIGKEFSQNAFLFGEKRKTVELIYTERQM